MKLLTFNGNKDYNKLNHLPFNRNFKVRNDLTVKMNLYGFTSPINIIETSLINGKKQRYIADGQNRAITAAFLDIPFYGVLVEKEFKTITEIVEYVASLNSAHKPWVTINYVESFAYLGYEDYKKLLEITQKTPYSVDTIASLLQGYRSKGYNSDKIKQGEFKIKQLQETQNTLELSSKLSKIERLTSRMLLALHYISSLNTFNREVFIKNYTLNAKKVKELKLDDYTTIFQSWAH